MATDVDDIIDGELIESDSASGNRALAGQNMLQVRGSYATAVSVQNPRSIKALCRKLLEEANLAGESFYYGWSVGRDKIEGPSVGLAVAAARCWGNCAIEQLPMQETGDSWIFTATFVDLETGFTLARQFRQSKRSTVAGKMDAERKDDIRFQIGQSKATRNVILKALPEWLIDQALEAAKEGVRAKIEKYIKDKGMPAAVDAMVKALAKIGVPLAAILEKCGVAAIEGLNVEHLVVLKGDLSALQNGQERAESLFPTLTAPSAPGSKARRSDLNDKLPPKAVPAEEAEFKHAEPDDAWQVPVFGPLASRLKFATESKDLSAVETARKGITEAAKRHADEQQMDLPQHVVDEINRLCDVARAEVKGERGEASNKKQGDLL